eukprot:2155938-Rhodomonas_salina.2
MARAGTLAGAGHQRACQPTGATWPTDTAHARRAHLERRAKEEEDASRNTAAGCPHTRGQDRTPCGKLVASAGHRAASASSSVHTA